MTQQSEKQIIVLNTFLREKIVTLTHLATLFHCSMRTVQRRLQQWETYKSYNQNGRFLTIAEVAHFDQNGLWKYGNVFFSKFGNLRDTIIGLVHASSSGLTGKELGNLLGLLPRSFLSHFRFDPSLHRETLDGLYVYFSRDPAHQREQFSRRMSHQARLCEQKKLPVAQSIIALLVELVNNPDSPPERLKERLAAKGCFLSREEIEGVFRHFQLGQKKT